MKTTDTPADGDRASASGVHRVLLGAAAIVVIIAGLKLMAWLVAPVMLALVLVVAVAPLQGFLLRHGWPRWLTAGVILVGLYGFLAAFAVIMASSIGRLAALLPQYAAQADELIASLHDLLSGLGFSTEQITGLVETIDPSNLVALAASLLGSLMGLLTNLLFLLGLLLFMAVDAAGFPDRLANLARSHPELADAFRSFAKGTRQYLLVSTVFGLVVAVIDGVGLWLLGVPLPILWALLAFVTNYIPNVGFIIGLLPPALLGLLSGGVGTMLWVVALYCVANFVLQSLVQPKVVGNSIDLSVTMTFLALVFWSWTIGGLGAVLAIPLTLLVKALLVDASAATRWANNLLSAKATPSVKRRRS